MSPQRVAQVAAATVRDILYSNPMKLSIIVAIAVTIGFNIGRILTFYQFSQLIDRIVDEHRQEEGGATEKELKYWYAKAQQLSEHIRRQQEVEHAEHEGETDNRQATSEAQDYAEETAESS